VRRPPLPRFLRDLLAPVAGRIDAWRTRGLTSRERWERALGTEVAFWDQNLAEAQAGAGYLDPDSSWATDPVHRRALERVDGEHVRVVDVGAGPLTAVPKRGPGRTISIVAFDPLADAYNRRLDELGIVPLVRTQYADGERLLERVDEGSFDVAHATNCLDHAYDPALVIRSMALAVRPGGMMFLRHHRNEATNAALSRSAPVELRRPRRRLRRVASRHRAQPVARAGRSRHR